MKFDRFLDLIPKISNIPLLGESSHFKMVPPIRKELLKKQQHSLNHARCAGVIALFYPDIDQNTKVVLILRKTYKGVHSAQVGFPGGKLEREDGSLQDAALRETNEEIGVQRKDITIIRALSQVYIPPSNFDVFPFLGYTPSTPNFVIQDDEVEALIKVNMDDILEQSNIITVSVSTSYSSEIDVPAFKLNGYTVWGATAMMLSEIKDLFNKVI